MRLEINAGGLRRFIDGITGFVNTARSTTASTRLINELQRVSNRTDNISGGVGALGQARGLIRNRIRTEENRATSIINVQRKANSFVRLAAQTDNQVAAMVRRDG